MASMTECLYEVLRVDGDAVASILAPQTLAAGITATPTVDMSTFRRVLFVLRGGAANDADATLDCVVHECTQANDGGGDAQILAGKRLTKAIATVTAGAGFATLNDVWVLEVRAEEMSVNAGFGFLLLSITVSAEDTWLLSAGSLRDVAAYEPVATTNVTEIVD